MTTERIPYLVLTGEMSFPDWANSIVGVMNGVLPPYNAKDESEWQTWAANVAAAPLLADLNIPSPYRTDSWRLWAADLMTTLTTAGI